MGSLTPNPKKRGYLLPPGCKDLIDVLNGPPPKPSQSHARINGKIKAKVVRVIDENGKNLGNMSLTDALALTRSRGIDLIEIAPTAKPPVCRMIDWGKYKFEASKKKKKKKP